MKAVRKLDQEPQAMTDYRLAHPDEVAASAAKSKEVWSRFRDDPAYKSLRDELVSVQQGLCLYCEQRLSDTQGKIMPLDYQVEHVLAKSGASGRTLDWTNLALGCGGGAYPYHADVTRKGTGAGNLSCGAKKGEQTLPVGCDPRHWKLFPNLVRVELDGRIEPDPAACRQVGLSDTDLKTAIDSTLNLNCERLRMARQQVGDKLRQWILELQEDFSNVPVGTLETLLEQVVVERLKPDAGGHMSAFWTTQRQAFDEVAEHWIRRNQSLFS